MNETVVETHDLTKQFGDETAVDDLSFEISKGTIFGLIGPSGCGKTTTIRLLTGIYEPTSGRATVLGTDPREFRQKMRNFIGYMPQLFVLYPDLTVWEDLNFAASIYGVGRGRGGRLRDLLDFVELTDHRHKVVRDISGGMQRRLSLAATLVHDPELLLLDEPTAGIDPVLRRKFWDYFHNLQDDGRTLLVTTQYVSEAAYCDIVGVMDNGRLVMVETPDELRRQAYGGEVVDMLTAKRLPYAQLQEIADLPFVRGTPERIDTRGLRVIVDDTSTAIPELLQWCNQRDIDIETVDEYLPPFDDVFVELMNHKTENGA
jgi:ABC-2 type transport system ATP-binding protein